MKEPGDILAPPDYPRPPTAGRKSIRSRKGCLTCKRRKVKCDEQRPWCSHCQRLNIQCTWRSQSSLAARTREGTAGVETGRNSAPPSPATPAGSSPNTSTLQPHLAVDEVFDYASFMWDHGDLWQPAALDMVQSMDLGALVPVAEFAPRGQNMPSPAVLPVPESSVPDSSASDSAEMNRLLGYFAQSGNPPILAEMETQKTWLTVRQAVLKMASASTAVRDAILAFSNLLLCRPDGPMLASRHNYYEHAVAKLATYDSPFLASHSSHRENILAALFFLSYVDILESRLEAAHAHLKRAYTIFRQGDKGSFAPIEKQFLLWIRLLDGRAVSAGGEGLFLSQDNDLILIEASPTTLSMDTGEAFGEDAAPEGDVEDVLLQVLYQPGVVFYQKVQGFMGRISKIDPWHRSRGTVKDEIEVMNIGAVISGDLRTLYDHRPALMDYAVAGRLTEPHVSAYLASFITPAFRTYLSNYYASKIHLHRVAYKNLPLTSEASEAIDHIRRLARLIVADLDADDTLPVNMLWPLLMLGVEEQDPGEKAWIRTQIVKMERVVGNAKITAQVLDEVQARQDATKTRVDIRSVMHAVFNSCFAIL